mgnify:CR=1 FL=1
MTPDQFTLFQDQLFLSVAKFLEEGGTLIDKSFGSTCSKCPLSILVGKDADSLSSSSVSVATSISQRLQIDLTKEEMWDFIAGYDQNNQASTSKYNSPEAPNLLYELGKTIRNMYLAENYLI